MWPRISTWQPARVKVACQRCWYIWCCWCWSQNWHRTQSLDPLEGPVVPVHHWRLIWDTASWREVKGRWHLLRESAPKKSGYAIGGGFNSVGKYRSKGGASPNRVNKNEQKTYLTPPSVHRGNIKPLCGTANDEHLTPFMHVATSPVLYGSDMWHFLHPKAKDPWTLAYHKCFMTTITSTTTSTTTATTSRLPKWRTPS